MTADGARSLRRERAPSPTLWTKGRDMASVRIKVRPTGLINGREWPPVGETIDLPDAVAEGMAGAGHVEIVKDEPKVEKRPAPTKRVEKRTSRRKAE